LRSGLGAAGSITTMSGLDAHRGFKGTDDTIAVFTGLARISFHANLGSRIRVRTAVVGGVDVPAVRVSFGEHEVASWGRPLVVASTALEAVSF
jgi:hypothetical protein